MIYNTEAYKSIQIPFIILQLGMLNAFKSRLVLVNVGPFLTCRHRSDK